MNGFLRAATYLRVSSQKQADEMTIRSQRQDILTRIESDRLHLDGAFEFADDGYSGTDMVRPALERLRDQVAASLIDRLYVHSPDRLARKFAHQAILLEEFGKHDCEVVFLNQDGLPQSPEANLLLQMQGMIAEYEREKILERTRRGRRFSAAQGNVSVFSGAPYGYRYISRKAGDGQARWDIDPCESQVVQLIFDLYAVQGQSLAAICRELADRNIPTQMGNQNWDRSTLLGILRRHAYYGQAHYGGTHLEPRKSGKRAKRGDPAVPHRSKVAVETPLQEQVIIEVPALISQTVFEEAGKRMNENRKRQRTRQEGTKYLLSGLLLCGQCGSAYCAHRQPGGKRFSYVCLGRDKYRHHGRAICNNGSVRGTALDEMVWKEMCKLLGNPRQLERELARRQSESNSPASNVETIERRVKDLRARLDRLIDAYAGGHLVKDEFESRIRPLRDRHDRELSALSSLRGQLNSPSDASKACLTLERLSKEVGAGLETAVDSLKRELIELLIDRIEIHEETIQLVYKVPTNPFMPSPDSRGNFQHCLQRQHIAWGEPTSDSEAGVTPGKGSRKHCSRGDLAATPPNRRRGRVG